jgi:hypothetical protein
MDLGTGIAVVGVAVSLLGGFKIAWPTLKERENTRNDARNDIEFERRGTCSAHVDLVEGLKQFRLEVNQKFETLTGEIIKLCKEMRK